MLIECTNVRKKYLNKEAVKDASFSIEKGNVYAMLGPNGSGKTTLMKMLGGLSVPTSGIILYDGRELTHKTKAKIAYMPTEPFFYDYMTVKNVGEYYNDMFADFDLSKYVQLCSELELISDQKCRNLSSGLAAKLKIAATLSRKAELIMLDEPLNGIDLIARDSIIDCIIGSVSPDTAMIVSSHLVEELERIVDNVIFVKDGEIALAASAEELRINHGSSVVDSYREIYKYGKGGKF